MLHACISAPDPISGTDNSGNVHIIWLRLWWQRVKLPKSWTIPFKLYAYINLFVDQKLHFCIFILSRGQRVIEASRVYWLIGPHHSLGRCRELGKGDTGHVALLSSCTSFGTETGSSLLWLHPSNSVTYLGWLSRRLANQGVYSARSPQR